MAQCIFKLGVLILLYTFGINALPAIQPSLSPALTLLANDTKPGFLTKELTAFPPGPPPARLFYPVPSATNLMLEFSPLGLIPHRDESLVKSVILQALFDSLEQRVTAKMPGRGYMKQKGNFVVSVVHSAGAALLTWGMWTSSLQCLEGYVRAYPGYDFQFEVRLVEGEEIEGHVIGAGFAITRGRA
ncbi:MAG: hypothetical protein Q9222_006914 [Ikaeria aurantiellina]